MWSNSSLRKHLTTLRCSGHCLEIEVGRHKNIDARERKVYKIAVETEEHFLRFCPGYNDLRPQYTASLESLQRKEILECGDGHILYM